MKKKLTKKEKILCCVDDEIYLLKKRVQFKYDLTWAAARNSVNSAIKHLYSIGKKK